MRVLAMMPFNEKFKPIRESIRLAATTAHVECVFADEITQAGGIIDQIVAEIRQSCACVADVTGQNANVVWEVGYAMALGKQVITMAQSPADLFFNLKGQRTIIYDPDESKLPLTHRQTLITWLNGVRESHSSVPPEDLVGCAGHEKTSLVLGAKRVVDTQYCSFDLMGRAKDHILMAAQNHFFFLDKGEQLREALLRFLDEPSRRVDIMLCDPRAAYAVQTWQYVTCGRYKEDLDEASVFFGELDAWAKGEPRIQGRLTIRFVPFVPMSVTFVDPGSPKEGFLVLTPNAYAPENISRPCFVISRSRNDDIFQQYWAAYIHHFNDDRGRPDGTN